MKANRLIQGLLIILGLLGLFLRLYRIETVPPHLSNDEISIAYDAYSINRVQKDEYGHLLPIAFTSHGTYKAPGYAYILSPLFSLMKNSNTTARLPSIFFGLLTVYLIYLITYKITQNKIISLTSVVILISAPWHIITSRMVLESNIALFFLSLAVYLFLISTDKFNTKFLYFSVFSFALSMYCYHTEWGLSPLLLLMMIIIFYRKNKKKVVLPSLFFLMLILPLFLNYVLNLNTSARANTEILWKGQAFVQNMEKHSLIMYPIIFTKALLDKYLEYSNPFYLFFSGTEIFSMGHVYEQGLFLWPLSIPLVAGLIFLKKYIKKKYLFFLYLFIFVSPLVSSLTHGTANLVRNLNSVIPYAILIAVGFYHIYLKSIKQVLFLLLLTLTSFVYFFFIYLYHYPIQRADGFQGYRPIANYLEINNDHYQHVYIDTSFGRNCEYVGVPHLYFTYYQSLNPDYLINRYKDENGMHFNKYTVSDIKWNNLPGNKGDLYVVSVCKSPPNYILDKIKLTISIPDVSGNPAYELWETK